MSGRTLIVTLADELDAKVKAAAAEGEYASAEECSLDVERLRRFWQEGIDSGAGRGVSFAELRSEARNRLAQK